jgi:hypothetical protein
VAHLAGHLTLVLKRSGRITQQVITEPGGSGTGVPTVTVTSG